MTLFKKVSIRLKAFKNTITDGSVALVAAENTFSGDGFATIHDISFSRDKIFVTSMQDAFACLPKKKFHKHLIWRFHIVRWLAAHAMKVPGDFVECGVNFGLLSKFLCSYYKKDFEAKHKQFYLYDSWGDQLVSNHPDYKADIYSDVLARFSAVAYARLIRGLLPDSLLSTHISIAYLSLDLNCAKLEFELLQRLWPVMPKGAALYIDDYLWNYYTSDDRTRLEIFLANEGQCLISFPCGSAALIKS